MHLDAHAHFFTEAHLDDATEGSFFSCQKPPAYTLREHLDGLMETSSGDEGSDNIVVVNVALSVLPTSKHVLDSFDELTRLQTLYGNRYGRVRCILGTCRADEPDALKLLESNPLIIGARVFLKGVAPSDAAATMARFSGVTTLLGSSKANGKWLELFATDVDTLIAAVIATPYSVPLMIDHLGAWAAPPMDKYKLLLSVLAERQQQPGGGAVLLKGPGHRTSFHGPVTATYVAAAAKALGAAALLLSATDAPHVFTAPAAYAAHLAQRGCVAGALSLQRHVLECLRGLGEDWLPSPFDERAAHGSLLRFAELVGEAAQRPRGMIHAHRPRWYTGDDLMIPVPMRTPPQPKGGGGGGGGKSFGWIDGEGTGEEMMHAILFRPLSSSSIGDRAAVTKSLPTTMAPPPMPRAGTPPTTTTTTAAAASSSSFCDGRLVCIVGSGYTGFLGLYPALLSQELTRRGITTIALEYPCYGASTGRGQNEVSIAAQARAWASAAEFARDVLGFSTVIGAAWAMGSAALTQATTLDYNPGYASLMPAPPPPRTQRPMGQQEVAVAEKREEKGEIVSGGHALFDGVCLLNALLDADKVHSHVIASVNEKREELVRRIGGIPGLVGDVSLPPSTLAEFRKQVFAMEDRELYAGFAGYPLDAETLDVVIRQLYTHEGYAVPPVRGAFWKELAQVGLGRPIKLPLGTRALVIHGALNELHHPSNTRPFLETNKGQLAHGGEALLLPNAKHNDFMHFGNPTFEEMVRHVTEFALATNVMVKHGNDEDISSTHTQGKHNFNDLYNAPDASQYMREMAHVMYEIGDHTANIALNAMHHLFSSDTSAGALPPVVLELCAGYGLSMAPLRTTYLSSDVFTNYLLPRIGSIEQQMAKDREFFVSAARASLPDIEVVGVDIAQNALSYGKAVGFFDETICCNLEDDETNLSPAEEVLCSRARLVLATGALSYITSSTLSKLKNDLEVFYDPSRYWLPQRIFADAAEAAAMQEAELDVLRRRHIREECITSDSGSDRAFSAGHAPPQKPNGAKAGYIHATPLIAGPRGLDLARLVPQWVTTLSL